MKARTLFVDVDTQRDFLTPGGALVVPEAEKIIPALERLTRMAQRFCIPVLATMDTHAQDDPEFSQFPPHCVEGTRGWEKIEATTAEGQQIFPKATFDVFSNPAFAQRIQELAPQRAVVYGVATDFCVKAAALGLTKLVPEVVVTTDAIKPVTAEGGRAALEEMREAGCRLISTSGLEGILESESQREF